MLIIVHLFTHASHVSELIKSCNLLFFKPGIDDHHAVACPPQFMIIAKYLQLQSLSGGVPTLMFTYFDHSIPATRESPWFFPLPSGAMT